MADLSVGDNISLGNIDLTSMSIDSAMLIVQTMVIKTQTTQVEDFMKKVQDSNKKLALQNKASDLLNSMITEFKGSSDSSKSYNDVNGNRDDRNAKLTALRQAMADAGLTHIDGVGSDETVTLGRLQDGLSATTNAKSTAGNASQLDMVSLQAAMSQMATAVATATSSIKSIAESKQGVARSL